MGMLHSASTAAIQTLLDGIEPSEYKIGVVLDASFYFYKNVFYKARKYGDRTHIEYFTFHQHSILTFTSLWRLLINQQNILTYLMTPYNNITPCSSLISDYYSQSSTTTYTDEETRTLTSSLTADPKSTMSANSITSALII